MLQRLTNAIKFVAAILLVVCAEIVIRCPCYVWGFARRAAITSHNTGEHHALRLYGRGPK